MWRPQRTAVGHRLAARTAGGQLRLQPGGGSRGVCRARRPQWAAWWSAAAARSTEPEGQPCGCEAGIGERRFNALQQCSKPPRLPHYRTIVSPVTRRGEAQPRADVQTGYSVEAAAMRKRRDTHPELDRARRCRCGSRCRGRRQLRS